MDFSVLNGYYGVLMEGTKYTILVSLVSLVVCGQQGNAKPQPPDILPVEVDPPRHKIQRTGAEQAAPAVPCAEQNLAPEA